MFFEKLFGYEFFWKIIFLENLYLEDMLNLFVLNIIEIVCMVC